MAYKVGSLDDCNEELSKYGPENFNDRIAVKLKEGQETAVEKHNIQVSSFSGNLSYACGCFDSLTQLVNITGKIQQDIVWFQNIISIPPPWKVFLV